ncbi:MAG: ABC transporter permease subunit [Alphaproteobacteria bacterium]
MTVEPQESPEAVGEKFPFAETVNEGQDWLKVHFRWFTRAISGGIRPALDTVETFMILLPWPVVVLAIVLPALSVGGLRLGLICIVATMFWGFMDMWDPAMETLSLMAIAVIISVVLGVLIGIATSQSNVMESIVRPVLDTMQTMPAFVYLIPAVFSFGIGGAPAILATVIYALPPAVRLTNLGIRQVSPEILEAARSFGSTPLQLLIKVKIPLALVKPPFYVPLSNRVSGTGGRMFRA